MTEPRRPLVAGNWKMNCLSADGIALAKKVAKHVTSSGTNTEVAICPPYTLLGDIKAALAGSDVRLGAQDCHAAEKGAHTGDISVAMLADVGCAMIIVGHSERRSDHGEDDALVRAKAVAAQAGGMTAIICIGETETERDAGQTLQVVTGQLRGSVPEGATSANTVIAYEPVWAIGTGRTPTIDDVQVVHAAIRSALGKRFGDAMAAATRVLYGGSMKPSNAAEFVALADVDGGLIGGASLNVGDFSAIIDACGS